MGDRGTGRFMVMAYWETQAALEASENAALEARSRAQEEIGVVIEFVEYYEVVARV